MLFVGDSFTPGGIDDYCAQNRNWLGKDVGFDRCVALIERLRPTHIFNCHVDVAFDFTPEQCRFMHDNLAQREQLFGQLFPWTTPTTAWMPLGSAHFRTSRRRYPATRRSSMSS